VPTGMKTGVRMGPRRVRSVAARAAPSVDSTVKWLGKTWLSRGGIRISGPRRRC